MQVLTAEDINFCISEQGAFQFYVKGIKTPLPDFVIPRTGSGTRNFAIAIYKQLELLGIPMINTANGIVAAMDKFYSLQLLHQRGLPIPKTMFITEKVNLKNVEQDFSYPLIAKTWPGSEGEGVMLIHDKYNLEDMVSMLRKTNAATNILIQEYISNSRGKDIRVVTLGNEVKAMAVRKSIDDGYKSNVARGGTVTAIATIDEVKEIALKAAQALNLEYAGIDILEDVDGYKICEVNSAPGFSITDKIDIDIATVLYDYLERKMNLVTL